MSKHLDENHRPKPKPKPKPKRLGGIGGAILLALCVGCSGMVHVDAIDGPVGRIADRHDAYVRDDSTLSDDEKDIYLRTSELLRRIMAEAKK